MQMVLQYYSKWDIDLSFLIKSAQRPTFPYAPFSSSLDAAHMTVDACWLQSNLYSQNVMACAGMHCVRLLSTEYSCVTPTIPLSCNYSKVCHKFTAAMWAVIVVYIYRPCSLLCVIIYHFFRVNKFCNTASCRNAKTS